MKRYGNFFRSDNPMIRVLNKYSILFQALFSCLLVVIIEWISRHSLISAVGFVLESPLTFLYNVLLVFATFLIVYMFKIRTLVRLVLTVFWLLLGIINGALLANRVTPFNFTDLKMIGDLLAMKNSKYFSFAEEVAVIIMLAAVVCFLIVLGIKGPRYQGKMHRFRSGVCLFAMVFAIPFITRAAIQSDILAGYFGNLAQGYKDYGFVYSFTSSALDTGMSEPDDYSEERIAQIQDSVNLEPTTVAVEDLPNIIFVQLETFIDPYELKFLEYSEDPIPTFHSLMENYSSGYLTVPVVGAGTANTEFEVLTGMGISYFGLGEYPYKTILKETTCESAATGLKQIGYSTHALHNNGGNFYGRAEIFSQMGFDSFTSKELMNITEYNELKSWPKDKILLGETQKILDSTPGRADFIYTITVQSHGNYPEYKVFEHPEVSVTGGETVEENYQWEYYINELRQVDTFIRDLIEELNQRDEKTLLVLYGDHLPTMGLENSDMRNGDIYKTTYATWNNFDMEKQDMDMTSYQLMACMTDRLGIHQGTMFTWHQQAFREDGWDTAAYDANRALLQYDMLYGEHFVYGETSPYVATDIQMGVQDIIVGSVRLSADESEMVVRGKNFTPWSKVFADGERLDTEYVSDTELHFSYADLDEEVTFVVNQMGSSNTIFRSSNEVEYHFPENFLEEKHEEAEVEDTDNGAL